MRVRNIYANKESRDDALRDVREAVHTAIGSVRLGPGEEVEEEPRPLDPYDLYNTEDEVGTGPDLDEEDGVLRHHRGALAALLDAEPLGEGKAVITKAVHGTLLRGEPRRPVRHFRVPLVWFHKLKRDYRGEKRTYHEAVLVLAYVVGRYATGDVDRPGLLYVQPRGKGYDERSVDAVLDLTVEQRTAALVFLEGKGLLQRVLVRGVVPWWHKGKRGSYLFVVPQIQEIRKLSEPDIESHDGPL